MQKREHVHYFDYLRVIAAFFVIYMHVAATPLRAEMNGEWQLINLLTGLCFTAVPLFFMMSGYLLLTDEKTSDVGILLRHRIPKLLIPLAFWSLVAIATRLHYAGNLTAGSFFDSCISALNSPAAAHLWYVYTLIALYLISPILYGGLKHLSRGGHILVVTIIVLISLKPALQALLPSSLDRFLEIKLISQMGFLGNHLCTFILGFYLGKLKKKIPNILLISAIVFLTALISYGTYSVSLDSGQYTQTFQNQSAGFEIFLAAALFLLFKQIANRKSKLFGKVPIIPLSFAIYLMHNIILYALERNDIIAHTFADTLTTSLLIYLASFLVAKTLATIKPLCYITTGIPFKSACKSCNWIKTFKKAD